MTYPEQYSSLVKEMMNCVVGSTKRKSLIRVLAALCLYRDGLSRTRLDIALRNINASRLGIMLDELAQLGLVIGTRLDKKQLEKLHYNLNTRSIYKITALGMDVMKAIKASSSATGPTTVYSTGATFFKIRRGQNY